MVTSWTGNSGPAFDHHHRERIDIASANTMIVNRADTFGLSQLYQLRGQVGRSKNGPTRTCSCRRRAVTRDAAELEVRRRSPSWGRVLDRLADLRSGRGNLGHDQSGTIARSDSTCT
jgi:transcription-repair coupling factor (superfamily II helicase)